MNEGTKVSEEFSFIFLCELYGCRGSGRAGAGAGQEVIAKKIDCWNCKKCRLSNK